MPACMVKGCLASKTGLKLHRLPNGLIDPQRTRKWLDVTGNQHIPLEEAIKYFKTGRYAVCEHHFAEEAYQNPMRLKMIGGYKFLKKDAIPTLNLCHYSSKIHSAAEDIFESNNTASTISSGLVSLSTLDINRKNSNLTCHWQTPASECAWSNYIGTCIEASPSMGSLPSDDDGTVSCNVTLPTNCLPFHSYTKLPQQEHVKLVSRGTQTKVLTKDVAIQVPSVSAR